MKIPTLLRTAVLSLDEKFASTSLLRSHEQGALLCFLIHGLFASKEEAQCGLIDPQQGFTVAMLREFLAHFTGEGYRFLSPADLGALRPHGKYVLLTFDDGYYNNIRALPLLEEFDVPAVFFISSDHVKYGKAFWWDAVYRECKRRGQPTEELGLIVARYKQRKTAQIEADIAARFGRSVLRPVSDLDRPFTPAELRKFSSHRLVFLGNHTRDHAILTNYPSSGIGEQILSCQAALQEMAGQTPRLIAYPNGNCSGEICGVARDAGLEFGLLATSGRNRLPLNAGSVQAMTLKRFTLWGNCSIEAQCHASRSPVSLYRALYSLRTGHLSSLSPLNSFGKAKSLARSPGS